MPGPITELATSPLFAVNDEISDELTRIWQELLGVTPIAQDQNYFDLGGDSPLAVQLFARIEKSFNVKLPLATLFEAPTIGDLAETIRRERPASGWSSLVAIQPKGSRPPFFCMHGAGGNVLIYRALSLRLGPDQPFYGLQSRGLDGSCEPFTRVEDMAALYIKEIQRVQPEGPYLLGGYCMGGTIALEVARQLRAKGKEVALLALFDTLNWCKIPLPAAWDKAYTAIEKVAFHAANVLRLDSSGKARFLAEKIKITRSRLPVWRGAIFARFKSSATTTSRSEAASRVWKANDDAAMDYVPQPYPGTIVNIRPFRQYKWLDRPGVQWDRLAVGGEKAITLPVYPAGMLVEPFVKHLAGALSSCIEEALKRRAVSP